MLRAHIFFWKLLGECSRSTINPCQVLQTIGNVHLKSFQSTKFMKMLFQYFSHVWGIINKAKHIDRLITALIRISNQTSFVSYYARKAKFARLIGEVIFRLKLGGWGDTFHVLCSCNVHPVCLYEE